MVTKLMIITYKDGHQCEDHPVSKDEDEWWKLVMDISSEMSRPQNGVLLLSHPYGMHQVSEISDVHFGDDPAPPELPSLGFQRE